MLEEIITMIKFLNGKQRHKSHSVSRNVKRKEKEIKMQADYGNYDIL